MLMLNLAPELAMGSGSVIVHPGVAPAHVRTPPKTLGEIFTGPVAAMTFPRRAESVGPLIVISLFASDSDTLVPGESDLTTLPLRSGVLVVLASSASCFVFTSLESA